MSAKRMAAKTGSRGEWSLSNDEVFVFGTGKYEFHEEKGVLYSIGFGWKRSQHSAKIFNEKTGEWQIYPVNEALIYCPVCGKLFKAYYIPGTTWFACCSKECYEKFDEKVKELGDFWKALEYFHQGKTMFGANPRLSSFREEDRLKGR